MGIEGCCKLFLIQFLQRLGDIFKAMFPDRSIAKSLSLDPLSYHLITNGLPSYFDKELPKSVESVVICFNEAFSSEILK